MPLLKLFTIGVVSVAASFPLASSAWAHARVALTPPPMAARSAPHNASSLQRTLASNDRFDPAAPLGSAANPIPENSPTPASQAYKLVAGDPNLVSNGPIPDTAANRARYGPPLSHAGRASDPIGN